MIADFIKGDVFLGQERHVLFAVNTEGVNDAGFAGQVALFWPRLRNLGEQEMGSVLSYRSDGMDKTYHALVCHSLGSGGWKETPEALAICLAKLSHLGNQYVAAVLMGSGPVGRMMGADVGAILKVLAQSDLYLAIYTR